MVQFVSQLYSWLMTHVISFDFKYISACYGEDTRLPTALYLGLITTSSNYRTEQNIRLGLTASLLAGRVAGFPQILLGPGQPSENRALTAPYFQRYLPKTGWRAIPVLVCSRHHAYRVPPLGVRKWILKDIVF